MMTACEIRCHAAHATPTAHHSGSSFHAASSATISSSSSAGASTARHACPGFAFLSDLALQLPNGELRPLTATSSYRFISHSWGGSFCELVKAAVEWCKTHGQDQSTTFVWLDVFCLNQVMHAEHDCDPGGL